MQVPVTEIETDDGVARHLPFANGAGVDVGKGVQQHRIQTATLAVQCPPRRDLLGEHLGHHRVPTEVDVLVDSVRRGTGDAVQLLLGAGGEGPHRRGPVARVLPHGRQKGHQIGPEVAQHGKEAQSDQQDQRQPWRRHVPDGVAIPVREAQEQEHRGVGEQHVPFHGNRQGERRDDEQVEAHHDSRRTERQPRPR